MSEEGGHTGGDRASRSHMVPAVVLCRDEEWNRNFAEVICEAAHMLSGSRDR